MKQLLLIGALAVGVLLGTGGVAAAQTLTKPKLFLPLDGATYQSTSPKREVASAVGQLTDVSAVVDGIPNAAIDHRHNVYHGAYSFQQTDRLRISNAAGTATLSSFFGIPGAADLKGFTISCWIYVNPAETVKRYIYYGVNAGNKLGFGLVLKGKELFLIKYVNNATGDAGQALGTAVVGNSWECSFRGPASFSAGAGWYQVILVQADYYTRVFVGMPPEQSGTTWAGENGQFNHNFSGNMVMHGKQDLLPFTKWGLGLPEGMTDAPGVRSSVLKMEDFMVFDYDLTEAQAEALYHCQAAGASEKCFGQDQVYTQRYAIIGDYGCDGGVSIDPAVTNPEGKVADMVKSWNPNYILTVGDDGYAATAGCGTSYEANVGKYYGAYIDRTSAVNNRFFPIQGNHDRDCPPGTALPFDCNHTGAFQTNNYKCECLWQDYFPTEKYQPGYTDPIVGQPAGFYYPGRYYSFKRGNIEYFALNSNKEEPDGNRSNSVQALWLKGALAQSTAIFKVVYMHHPPYSSRAKIHGGNVVMDTMSKWPFKAWGADIVIAGDNHFYERSDYKNLTVVVNGTSGYPGLARADSMIVDGMRRHVEKEFGAMLVEANDTIMHFKYITIDPANPTLRAYDRVRDEFWLYKKSGNGFYEPVIEGSGSSSRLATNPVGPVAQPVAVTESISPGLAVFPNPTTGDLTVRLDGQVQGAVTLKMVDVSGREAYAQRFFLRKGQQQLSLSNLKAKGVAQGMYFLQVITTESTRSVKVIVQ